MPCLGKRIWKIYCRQANGVGVGVGVGVGFDIDMLKIALFGRLFIRFTTVKAGLEEAQIVWLCWAHAC